VDTTIIAAHEKSRVDVLVSLARLTKQAESEQMQLIQPKSIKDRCVVFLSSNRLFNTSAGARFGAASSSISLLVEKAMHFPSHAVSGACLMEELPEIRWE
jgi:hypothetical protein